MHAPKHLDPPRWGAPRSFFRAQASPGKPRQAQACPGFFCNLSVTFWWLYTNFHMLMHLMHIFIHDIYNSMHTHAYVLYTHVYVFYTPFQHFMHNYMLFCAYHPSSGWLKKNSTDDMQVIPKLRTFKCQTTRWTTAIKLRARSPNRNEFVNSGARKEKTTQQDNSTIVHILFTVISLFTCMCISYITTHMLQHFTHTFMSSIHNYIHWDAFYLFYYLYILCSILIYFYFC